MVQDGPMEQIMAINSNTYYSPKHIEIYKLIRQYIAAHTPGGLRTKLEPPRSQPAGPVAWLAPIWIGEVGTTTYPAVIGVECRRDRRGEVTVRWMPRPRVHERKAPHHVPPALADLAQKMCEHLESVLQAHTEMIDLQVLAEVESPAQRKRREEAEARLRAREEAEAMRAALFDLFGQSK